MKVSMLRNPSSRLGCKLREGETGEVEKSVGVLLVKSGIAVEIESPPVVKEVVAKPIKAPVTRPAIAEAVSPAIKGEEPEKKPAPKPAAKPATKRRTK